MDGPVMRTCVTCFEAFTVAVGEQQSLRRIAERSGWATVELPKKCPRCRYSRTRWRRAQARHEIRGGKSS